MSAGRSEPTVASEWQLRCPVCRRDDALEIAVTLWANLTPDGTDVRSCDDWDWDRKSACQCSACGNMAQVHDFDCSSPPKPTTTGR